MPSDERESDNSIHIVWPNREQAKAGLANLLECLPSWWTCPALLVIKPDLGLIVSLQDVQHDEHGFALVMAVHEALVATPDFDTRSPVKVACVWNQPYLSMDVQGINAPFGFYLHFGAEGVRRARELRVRLGLTSDNPFALGLLRACFKPTFRMPDDHKMERK